MKMKNLAMKAPGAPMKAPNYPSEQARQDGQVNGLIEPVDSCNSLF